MAQVRPLPQLRSRYFAINLFLLGTALVTFIYLFFNAASRDATFWMIAGVFVASVAGCLLVDRVMVRSIKCPSCGRTLPKAKAPRGKFISVQYHCEPCQIIWDTEADKVETVRYSDPLE